MPGNLGRPYRHDHRPRAGGEEGPRMGAHRRRTENSKPKWANRLIRPRLVHITLGRSNLPQQIVLCIKFFAPQQS